MSATPEAVLWILEGNPDCQSTYKEIFSSQYRLIFFNRYSELKMARQEISAGLPELLIIDIETISHLLDRSLNEELLSFKEIPTVVITSIDCATKAEHCYKLGAMDYITKPFGQQTLLYKINRLIQKNTNPPQQKQLFEKIRNLTLKERLILESLFESKDLSATRKEIIEYVWKGVYVSAKTLDVHLYHLRRKIRPHGYEVMAQPNGRMKFCRKPMGGVESVSNALSAAALNTSAPFALTAR